MISIHFYFEFYPEFISNVENRSQSSSMIEERVVFHIWIFYLTIGNDNDKLVDFFIFLIRWNFDVPK